MMDLKTKEEFVGMENDGDRKLYLDKIFGKVGDYKVLAKVGYKKQNNRFSIEPLKMIVGENDEIKSFEIFDKTEENEKIERLELNSYGKELATGDYVLVNIDLNQNVFTKEKYPIRCGKFSKFIECGEIFKEEYLEEYLKKESLISMRGDTDEFYCAAANDVLEILKQLVTDYDKKVSELEKKFNEKNKELGNLEQEFNEKKDKLGNLEQEFNEKKDKLGNLEQEFNEKKDKLGNLEQEFNEKNKELTELINKNNILRKYSEVILDVNAISEEDKKQEAYEQSSFEDLAQSIVRECRYEYDVNLIKSMLCGIYSEQLVILAGAPGSGKTTFAKEFTKAIGYEAPIIPVQANWMDKSDLLGYYNPIEKCYMPTPFLEKLTHIKKLAEKYTDRYFFICLDEMNLSCVEYYFADFLSSLQTEERTIDLYSQATWERNWKELNSLDEKNADVENKIGNLDRYRFSISIPRNIRFIGTINIDDTTKDLSPKVVDRAYFIRLENDDKNTNEARDVEYKKYLKYVTLSGDIKLDDVLKLKEKFKKSGVTLSRRFDRAVKKICVNTPNASEIKDEIKDILVSGLVLPKLREKLREKCDLDANMKYSKAILQKMNVDGEVSYWRSLK